MRALNSNDSRRSARKRLSKASGQALESLERRVLMSTTIAAWSFPATVAAPDNSPAATIGTGTAASLGMTNTDTYAGTTATNSVTNDDITTVAPENVWRVRGAYVATGTAPNIGTPTKSGNVNGWNLSAPQYSQGVEFDVSTAGFQNITASFDWESTAQGVRDLQEQYNLNSSNSSGWTNINPLLVTPAGGGYLTANAINLSGISGANNDPSFGIRLVSAYDPTYTGTGSPSYSSATLTGGNPVQYNNSSGNWGFDNVSISGTASPVTPVIQTQPTGAAAAAGSNATFTASALTNDSATTVQWEVSTTGPSGTFNPVSTDSAPADSASTPSYNSSTGISSDTLTVPATAAKSGQYYEAIFTDTASPGSTTSGSAQLTVPAGPVVTTNPPAATTVNFGTQISLTAAASIAGTTAPSVQWKVSSTGANGTYTNITDPADVTNTFVTTGPSTTTSVYKFTPTEASTGDYYEAIFTSIVSGVTLTATTTPAEVTVVGTTLADWAFNSIVGAPYNSPSPIKGSGTLTSLGMDNQYNAVTSVTSDDTANSPTASSNPAAKGFNEDTWRIRGASNSGGTTNGWSNAAPEFADQGPVTSVNPLQGAEFDVPASGFNNFAASFDWYTTTQGMRDLQVQYFDPVTSAWVSQGSPYIAASNDFYGVNTGVNPGTGVPTPVFVNLQGIPDLSSVSTLKIRLVAAYDPNLPLIDDGNQLDVDGSNNPLTAHGQFASAATGGANEQQELSFLNVSASTFTLDYNGQNTGTISYSGGFATPGQGSGVAIQTALNALSSITAAGGVTVINPNGNPDAAGAPDDYTVIFNDPTNVAELPITVDASSAIPNASSPGTSGLNISTGSNGVVQYNNTSGNWRFDNIVVSGASVNNSPVVVAEPQNTTWTTQGVSTSVSFTSSAYADTQSTDPITVTWEEAPASSPTSFTPITGEINQPTTIINGYSSATLTITNIGNDTSQNGDQYEAVFSNSKGSATSNAATLFVVPPVAPTIGQQPVSVSVLSGTTAVFTATETGGTPVPTVQWQETDASGVFQPVQAGDVVTTSGTTTVTTSLSFIPTALDSGRDFRAIFFNAAAPGGVDTNVSPVAPAVLTVLPPETTITQWLFPGTVAAPDDSPSPTLNYAGAGNYETDNLTTGASLTDIGFSTANTGVAGETPGADITPTPGTAESSFSENLWRVRNTSPGSWDNTAPDLTQGAQMSVDTTGYSNIYMTFDWFSTAQGIRDLQEEYNTGSGWVPLGAPIVATANDYYGANAAENISHIPVVVDLTGVPAANNNPNLQIRLVSAYDPTVLNGSEQPFEYTSATVPSSGIAIKYNGTSGNWRFGNFQIEALPSWLSPTSAATWNPANNTLTVTGAATINADPSANIATDPTAEPAIVANGPTDAVSFTPITLTPASGPGTDFHIAGLTLTGGATAQVTSLGSTRSVTNYDLLVVGSAGATAAPTFTVDSSSKLDLADNDMAILYGTGTSPLANVQTDLSSAYDGGKWDAAGLTSSAAKSSGGVTALGYGEASTLGDSSFDGVTLGGNAVLIKYTLVGDTKLTGSVGLGDYNTVTSNLNASGKLWTDGAFDYSGNVSLGSYNDVLKNFNNTLANVLPGGAGGPGLVTGSPKNPTITPVPTPTPVKKPVTPKKPIPVTKPTPVIKPIPVTKPVPITKPIPVTKPMPVTTPKKLH